MKDQSKTNQESPKMTEKFLAILFQIIILLGLYLTSLYSYVLFHSIVEIFTILIGFSIFVIAWNSRKFLENDYLLFIGTSFLFVGVIDLLHTLAYKGMGVFHGYDANLPTQLWIAGRYVQSFSFFIAPLFFVRRLKVNHIVALYTVITFLLLGSIFYWGIFPDCFVEGAGLTPFKKVSEYVICIILFASLLWLHRKRNEFDPYVLRFLSLSILLIGISELAFTFYINVYGFSNLAGHLLRFVSYYILYKAVVEAALRRPYSLLFMNLKRSEEELAARVETRTKELRSTNEELRFELTERKRAEEALRKTNLLLEQSSRFTDALLSAIPTPVFYKDREGRYLGCNRAFTEIMGVASEEIKGKTVYELWPSEHAQVYHEKDLELMINPVRQIYDFKVRDKDGVDRPVIYVKDVFLDADNQIAGIVGAFLDITERKRAEEALHRLNRELRAISTCNQTLLRTEDEQALLNDICRIVCDEAGYRMAWVGYAEDDEAKTVRPVAWAGHDSGYIENVKLSWADDTERGRGPAGKAIRSGEIICVQDFITDPQMSPWRESALQRGYRSGIALPLKDENANVFGVLLIYSTEINSFTPDEIRLLEELAGDLAFGITTLRARAERKQAEEELRMSEERFRALHDASFGGIGIHDKGVILDCNQGLADMTGYTLDELIGMNGLGLIAPAWRDHVMEKILSGYEKPYEVEGLRKDGSIYPLQIQGKNIPYHGQRVRVTEFRDITERKQAEEKSNQLAAIVQSSDDAIIGKTLKGIVTNWNKGAEKIYGYTESEMIGKPISDLIPPEYENELPQIMIRIEREEYIEHYETVRRRKDGRIINVSLTVSPIHDSSGKVIAASTIARDITERKQAEEELKTYREHLEELVKERTIKLEASIRELEAFSYSVSHDLRAPLRSIYGFSQALLEEYDNKLDSQGKDYLGRVMRATQKMTAIIEDLLKLSRITRAEINITEINLTGIAQSVIDELRKSEPQRNINIKIAEGLKDKADMRLMHIALENLLGNAWKFTSKQPDALIEFGSIKKDNATVYFIRDNGAGFNMSYLDKLFTPFQRLHTEDEYPGTGIGLATVRRIIFRHGGNIWAEGLVNKGATFYFNLHV
jgi:PAS domain S-box-containing protein